MSDRHNRTKTASVGKTASAGTIKYFDYSLLFIIIFLVGFGLVMLYSVSAYEGQSVFNDPTHYLKRQVFSVGLGFIGMFVFTYFPEVDEEDYGIGICFVTSYVSRSICNRKELQWICPLVENRSDPAAAFRDIQNCGHTYDGIVVE